MCIFNSIVAVTENVCFRNKPIYRHIYLITVYSCYCIYLLSLDKASICKSIPLHCIVLY